MGKSQQFWDKKTIAMSQYLSTRTMAGCQNWVCRCSYTQKLASIDVPTQAEFQTKNWGITIRSDGIMPSSSLHPYDCGEETKCEQHMANPSMDTVGFWTHQWYLWLERVQSWQIQHRRQEGERISNGNSVGICDNSHSVIFAVFPLHLR
jgi:hypothetical protein